MKRWNVEIMKSQDEVIENFDGEQLKLKGFVFCGEKDESDCYCFKIRKRVKDFDKLFYYNLIRISGKISSKEKGRSELEIHFHDHLLNYLMRIILVLLSLGALIIGLGSGSINIGMGILFAAIGFSLYFWLNYRYHQHIKKYKGFLSDLLGFRLRG